MLVAIVWPSAGWVVVLVLTSSCVGTTSDTRRAPGTAPAEPLAAGLAALAAADYAGAEARLVEAAARYPALDDYALLFRARAAARAGRRSDALERVQDLGGHHPDSVWAGAALLLGGELLHGDGDAGGARAWFTQARAALPVGGVRWARASVGLAEVEQESGDAAAALALASEVRRTRPRELAARRARRLTDRIRATNPATLPDEHVDEAEMRLKEGDAAGARDEATAALGGSPPPSLTARALWVSAQAEHALGLEGADGTCLALARDLPADPLAPRALLTAASWRWNADDDATALERFRDLSRRFPQSPQAPEALYAIGRILQEEGGKDPARYDDAFAAYTGVGERYPQAPAASEARWRAGWVRYLAGDFAQAERAFHRATGYDTSARPAAEYWRARALDRLGRADEARERLEHLGEHYPTSYYAGLAEERLGQRVPVVEPPETAPRPSFPTDLSGPHAERAALLARLGFSRFACLEVEALRRAGAPAELILEAYRALGATGAALRLAREIEPESPNTPREELYPLGYWDAVRPAARARALDPLLVAALIRQESLFDPEAVSSANAHGLMQLLPATAHQLSTAAGLPPPTVAVLHDPAANVGLGVALLARLRDHYEGSLVKALAAYNAGEEAVAKWERRYGSRDADEFVELISYRETRDYVKAVLRNYRVYRRLYRREPDASPSETSLGSPPKAPFDMITMTSPERAEPTR